MPRDSLLHNEQTSGLTRYLLAMHMKSQFSIKAHSILFICIYEHPIISFVGHAGEREEKFFKFC